MTQLNDGSEGRSKESLEETMRVRAVEVAYQLLWNHPNWLRGYGFAVHDSQWPEFLESMGELKKRSRASSSGRRTTNRISRGGRCHRTTSR